VFAFARVDCNSYRHPELEQFQQYDKPHQDHLSADFIPEMARRATLLRHNYHYSADTYASEVIGNKFMMCSSQWGYTSGVGIVKCTESPRQSVGGEYDSSRQDLLS
jgi:hypothetical protein